MHAVKVIKLLIRRIKKCVTAERRIKKMEEWKKGVDGAADILQAVVVRVSEASIDMSGPEHGQHISLFCSFGLFEIKSLCFTYYCMIQCTPITYSRSWIC